MQTIRLALMVLFCAGMANAQASDAPAVQRVVKGQSLESQEAPRATFEFEKGFKYLGGQRFFLYGVADAEQHLFVKLASSGAVDRFYWVQFEHYLPSNTHTYDYKPVRTTQFGDFRFVYDTSAFNDYSAVNRNPESDGGKALAMLAKNGLSLPKRLARIRMFYLPNPDRRSELMIIYGEALASDAKVELSDDGTALDEQLPEVAKMIRTHAIDGVKITKR
jgi:hypothetical protein